MSNNYTLKPVVVEVFTFEEILAHGKENATSVVNGVPWAFTFKGVAFTHEREDCYHFSTFVGVHVFTKDHVLMVEPRGMYPCSKAFLESDFVQVGPAVSAMQILMDALTKDDEYAWAWHCNLAMPIMNSLKCTAVQANKAGADLMQHLFGIDIRKHTHWNHDAPKLTVEEYMHAMDEGNLPELESAMRADG
jgi:hypothetical protein